MKPDDLQIGMSGSDPERWVYVQSSDPGKPLSHDSDLVPQGICEREQQNRSDTSSWLKSTVAFLYKLMRN